VLDIRVNNDLGGLSHRLSLAHGVFDKLIKFWVRRNIFRGIAINHLIGWPRNGRMLRYHYCWGRFIPHLSLLGGWDSTTREYEVGFLLCCLLLSCLALLIYLVEEEPDLLTLLRRVTFHHDSIDCILLHPLLSLHINGRFLLHHYLRRGKRLLQQVFWEVRLQPHFLAFNAHRWIK
jgi:hypothetical protein